MKFRVIATLAAAGLVASVITTQSTSSAHPALLGRFEKKGAKKESAKKDSSSKDSEKAGGPGELKKRFGLAPRGMRWGMNNEMVAKVYDKIFDDQYLPLYKKVEPGPRMQALDAELAQKKALIRDSLLEFGDVPTGLDNSPLAGEYTYRNKESMSNVEIGKITRHFFYFDNRLWKIYDEYQLKKGGSLGEDFKEAVKILTKKFGVAPVMADADFDKHQNYDEAQWHDSATIYRALNREGEHVLGLVYVDKSVQDSIASYRRNKPKDANAMDKDVAAATRQAPDEAPPKDDSKDKKKKKGRTGH